MKAPVISYIVLFIMLIQSAFAATQPSAAIVEPLASNPVVRALSDSVQITFQAHDADRFGATIVNWEKDVAINDCVSRGGFLIDGGCAVELCRTNAADRSRPYIPLIDYQVSEDTY